MARPAARDLTERELEVMHVFWSRRHRHGRRGARPAGRNRARTGTYTTIATLVRMLAREGFSHPGQRRTALSLSPGAVLRGRVGPPAGRSARARLRGSREQLLVRLMEQRIPTALERAALEEILKEQSL